MRIEELNSELIFTGLEAENSDAVMEWMGREFVRQGYTKDSYVAALLAREKEYPTGLDLGQGNICAAIPHTDAEHVIKPGTGIGILKHPVSFHVMGGDEEELVQVSVVFMLAIKDPGKQLDRLQNIIGIIQDQKLLRELSKASSKEEVLKCLHQL
ncbi:MAG: PTS sugar transporter subunit IIA [Lachnospiraceae bacterium]|nr:PTS sugar transporter subunit IIA [Lachnospiraceae bacterium]